MIFGTGAVDPRRLYSVRRGSDLAAPPEFLLRPQYQTREQKKLMAMEGEIGDLTAFLKGMQARMDMQHETLKKTLDNNASVLLDLSNWKPQVQAEVEELQSGIRGLRTKVE